MIKCFSPKKKESGNKCTLWITLWNNNNKKVQKNYFLHFLRGNMLSLILHSAQMLFYVSHESELTNRVGIIESKRRFLLDMCEGVTLYIYNTLLNQREKEGTARKPLSSSFSVPSPASRLIYWANVPQQFLFPQTVPDKSSVAVGLKRVWQKLFLKTFPTKSKTTWNMKRGTCS